MKKAKVDYFYMHTISGKPAQYWPGEQICFAMNPTGVIRLAQSLTQIKQERKWSQEWRKAQGFDDLATYGIVEMDYGYVRIARKAFHV